MLYCQISRRSSRRQSWSSSARAWCSTPLATPAASIAQQGLVAIKPSGVDYEERLKAEDLVIVDLDGKIVEGKLNPSSDVKTHLLLYREFPTDRRRGTYPFRVCDRLGAGGHGRFPAMAPPMRTTFYGEVPVTRPLTDEEIEADYEFNTGVVIAARFERQPALDPLAVPGCAGCQPRAVCLGVRPRPRPPTTPWYSSMSPSSHFGLS